MQTTKLSLIAIFTLSLVACETIDWHASPTPTPEQTGEPSATSSSTPGDKTLIAYFTYGENMSLSDGIDVSSSASIQRYNNQLTGNTGLIAFMISEEIEADLHAIQTINPYPDNYNDTVDQGQTENSENYHPELASHLDSLDEYSTIFIGYPTWWGDLPMAMYSFFEAYDFAGKTIIPFNTSGGSGLSNTTSTIEELEPNATVLDGLSVHYNDVTNANEQVIEWLESLGY